MGKFLQNFQIIQHSFIFSFCSCFRSKSKTSDRLINVKLLLVPDENNQGERKQIVIELPRQLLAVHDLRENKAISLWEMSLRKVYLSRSVFSLSFHFNEDLIYHALILQI